MSHEPTRQEYTAALEAFFEHKRTANELPISAALTAANALRDKRIRAEALEEAASLCERKANAHGWNYHLPSVGRELAAIIRALKDKEPSYE